MIKLIGYMPLFIIISQSWQLHKSMWIYFFDFSIWLSDNSSQHHLTCQNLYIQFLSLHNRWASKDFLVWQIVNITDLMHCGIAKKVRKCIPPQCIYPVILQTQNISHLWYFAICDKAYTITIKLLNSQQHFISKFIISTM